MANKPDERIQWATKWTEYLKKYGLLGGMVALSPVIIPYIGDYLLDNSMKKTLAPIQRTITEVKTELFISRELMLRATVVRLMTADDFDILVRHRVRSQSIDKIKRVKRVLEEDTSKERKWRKIRNILYEETSIYVSEVKAYVHPVAGNIGHFLSVTFPMEANSKREYSPEYSFMDNVKRLVEQDETPEVRVNDLMEYMKSVQDTYFTDMYNYLKELERDKNATFKGGL